MGSMLQGGGNIVGTVVHLAAHGAAGGGMSQAMGGSFKDGFIGGVSGAGVAGAFGNAFSGVSEEIGVLGRTAVAAVGGGVASVLSGGKFADGAFSAAFFHLFNSESHRLKPMTVGESGYFDWPLENPEDLRWYASLKERYKGEYFNLVEFDSTSTFEGQSGITGQTGYMTMYGPDGQEVGRWEVSSGGYATDYRLKKLGGSGSTRIATGTYNSGMPSNGEFYPSSNSYTYKNSLHDPGFYNHGYSFKFGVGVPGNPSILFHPSGGGTQGCIGLNSGVTDLFKFNALMLNAALKQKSVRTIVK
jgi:hypothetical protein